jgi:hypothetical protein
VADIDATEPLSSDVENWLSFRCRPTVALKSVRGVLCGPASMGFGRREWLPSMPESQVTGTEDSAPSDLISFLKAIPDGRYRRGVRHPQWFLLLVAVLGILSGCRSSRDLERFARRHREALNQALGMDFKRWPSDATFLYLYRYAEDARIDRQPLEGTSKNHSKDWPDPKQELRLKQFSIPEWASADSGMKRRGSKSFATRSLY